MKKLNVFAYVLLILLSLVLLTIGTISVFSIKTLSDFIYSEVATSIIEEAQLIRNIIPANKDDAPEPYQDITRRIFEDLNLRISLINLEGKVLADSHENYLIMENHSDRPEIMEAVSGKSGKAIRYSNTLLKHMLYIAIPPGEKNIVVRIALSVDHIREKISETLRDISIFSIVILIIAILISILTANIFTSTIKPIINISEFYARGDFSKKIEEKGPKEVLQLKSTINLMGEQLQKIINEVSYQKNELQAMLNGMVDSVLFLDEQLRIKEMNPSAMDLFNIQSKNVKGEDITVFIQDHRLLQILSKSIENEQSLDETVYYNKDGIDQFLQIHSSLVYDLDKNCEGVLLVLHNMTRMKQLEIMRKDFVANVSHELKTPVTLITGFVETLIDGAMDDREKLEQFLNVINRHSVRISHIIDDLLILSNIEDKGTDITKEEVNLYDILFSAYTSALSSAENENIKMEIECEDSIKLRANPILIEQAVYNLLSNAIKYSGEKSTVRISGEVLYKDGKEKISIIVSDNGKGMTAEQLDRIFERFYRINRKQSRKIGGTGLGLSIVKHIVMAHSGSVSVESQPEKGSSFTIILPTR